MAWSEVDNGAGAGANAATASGLNLSGSSILIAYAAFYNAAALVAGDIADTSSNTWVPLSARTNGSDSNIKGQFLYVINPTTSASQDITVTKSGSFIGLTVVGLTGFTPTFSTESSGTSYATGATTVQAPSIGGAGDLVIAGMAWDNLKDTISIDLSFSSVIQQLYSAGVNEGCAIAWKEVSGAVQPTWSWTLTTNLGVAQNINFTSGGGVVATPARIIFQKA
jgi:hypothetical protein